MKATPQMRAKQMIWTIILMKSRFLTPPLDRKKREAQLAFRSGLSRGTVPIPSQLNYFRTLFSFELLLDSNRTSCYHLIKVLMSAN